MTEFTHDARVTKEARSLCQNGHKVVVAALKSYDTPYIEKRDSFNIQRIHVCTRYLLPKGLLFFFIKYIEFVLRAVLVLGKQKFEVYHAHDLETLPIAFILSRLRRRPVVYDSHELYVETEQHGKAAKWLWRHLENLLVKRVKNIIFVNESLAKIFADRYRVPLPMSLINCQYLNLHERSKLLRQRFSIPECDKIVIYQGGLSAGRGVHLLIEAMHYLEQMTLVIVGPGEFIDELRRMRASHPKREKIIIMDRVPWEELAQITASADIGVALLQKNCMNYYYSLPNKLFEYLSAGLPVVFSNFPEIRRVVVENKVGLVVDETNAREIAAAIDQIATNETLYRTMSENAKRIIINKYNWEIESQKLISLYRELSESFTTRSLSLR